MQERLSRSPGGRDLLMHSCCVGSKQTIPHTTDLMAITDKVNALPCKCHNYVYTEMDSFCSIDKCTRFGVISEYLDPIVVTVGYKNKPICINCYSTWSIELALCFSLRTKRLEKFPFAGEH